MEQRFSASTRNTSSLHDRFELACSPKSGSAAGKWSTAPRKRLRLICRNGRTASPGDSAGIAGTPRPHWSIWMKLWIDLFSTDYGLMSLIAIVLILCMAGFFLRLFLGKMKTIANKLPE